MLRTRAVCRIQVVSPSPPSISPAHHLPGLQNSISLSPSPKEKPPVPALPPTLSQHLLPPVRVPLPSCIHPLPCPNQFHSHHPVIPMPLYCSRPLPIPPPQTLSSKSKSKTPWQQPVHAWTPASSNAPFIYCKLRGAPKRVSCPSIASLL